MNSKIQVHIRIRPGTDNSTTIDGNNIIVGNKNYNFDIIYDPEADQSEIFTNVEPLLKNTIEGYNATIFAYGQTGSGKTYTMGMSRDGFIRRDGIVPRSIEYLFKKKNDDIILSKDQETANNTYNNSRKRKNDDNCELSMSFIEIYNEDVKDLLGNKANVFLREVNGEVQMAGVREIKIDSLVDTFEILSSACGERTTKSTRMNSTSSRSHAILTINMKKRIGKDFMISHVRFVDLAGSERVKRTGVSYEHLVPNETFISSNKSTMRESISINSGLLALGNVISALSKKMKHVPFRDSKLTRLLQSSLTGNYNTLMIACISPSSLDTNETQNTLKYALRATNISMCVQRNVTVDLNRLNFMELKKEIINLKEENKKLREKSNLSHLKSRVEFLERENKNLREELERIKKLSNPRPPVENLLKKTHHRYSVVNSSRYNEKIKPRYSVFCEINQFNNKYNQFSNDIQFNNRDDQFNNKDSRFNDKRKMPNNENRKMRHSVFARTPYALHKPQDKCINSKTINENEIVHKLENEITIKKENHSMNLNVDKKNEEFQKNNLFGLDKYKSSIESGTSKNNNDNTKFRLVIDHDTDLKRDNNYDLKRDDLNNELKRDDLNNELKTDDLNNNDLKRDDLNNNDLNNNLLSESLKENIFNKKIPDEILKEDNFNYKNQRTTLPDLPSFSLQIDPSEYKRIARISISNTEREDYKIKLIKRIPSSSIQSICQFNNSLIMGTLDGYLKFYDFVNDKEIMSIVEERTIKSMTNTNYKVQNNSENNNRNDKINENLINDNLTNDNNLNDNNLKDDNIYDDNDSDSINRNLNNINLNSDYNYGHCNLNAFLYSTGSKLKIRNETDLLVCAYDSDISSIIIRGNYIFTGHEDGTIQVKDIRVISSSHQDSIVKNRKIQIHRGTVFDICFLNNEIYTASRDHTVGNIKINITKYNETDCINTQAILKKDDISKYKFSKTILRPPHYDSVHLVLPFKNSIISASRDCSIKRWVNNKIDKTIPYAHDSWIKSGCVFQDFFATGCKEGVVMLWDFQRGAIKNVGKTSIESINCMVNFNGYLAAGCQKSLNVLKIS
ncbi:Chromosome-associated kinesin KIF4 [Dictyocoela muelleri]|nr:Chromosome-associated kinesin KIF4 [Dictyocoela muelleri]